MGTRSLIGLCHEDNSITYIRCTHDSYNNGKLLINHYNTPELISELLSHGEISSLGDSLDTTHFYHRDYGEDLEISRARDMDSFIDAGLITSDYIFLFNNNEWLTLSNKRDLTFTPVKSASSKQGLTL